VNKKRLIYIGSESRCIFLYHFFLRLFYEREKEKKREKFEVGTQKNCNRPPKLLQVGRRRFGVRKEDEKKKKKKLYEAKDLL
jgi:hypothetical protein